MTIDRLDTAFNNFIHEQFMVNPNTPEEDKAGLLIAKRLGYIDVKLMLGKILGNDFVKNSPTLWLDEEKTSINIDVLKGIAEDWLNINPAYMFKGIDIDFLFKKYNVLGGYKIDKIMLDNLFRHIDQQGV